MSCNKCCTCKSNTACNCTSSCSSCCGTTVTDCCKTTVVLPADQVETVSHADNVNVYRAGPYWALLDHFAIPAVGAEGVLRIQGEVLQQPRGAQVYISVGENIARLAILSVTAFYGDSSETTPCDTCNDCCTCSSKSFEDVTTEITVTNQGLSCNTIPAGTYVAKGTAVGFDFAECNSTGGGVTGDVFLCDKYHAPQVGETTTISVTPDTNTLAPLDIIQFSSYTVVIVSLTATTLTVRNDGLGGSPGTIVDGTDCSSIKIFRVSGEDPCGVEVTEADSVLVCDNGVQKSIVIADGQVLAKENGRYIGRTINDDGVCTTLTSCLKLDPDNETQTYVVDVASTTGIEAGDGLTIEGKTFTVTTVIDGDTLRISPTFTVTAIESYDEGTIVCVSCCVTLQTKLDGLRFSNNSFNMGGTIDPARDIQDIGEEYSLELANGSVFTIGNPSLTVTSMAIINYSVGYTVNLGTTGRWQFDVLYNDTGVQPPTTVADTKFIETFGTQRDEDVKYSGVITSLLNPGETKNFVFALRIRTINAAASASIAGNISGSFNIQTIPIGFTS